MLNLESSDGTSCPSEGRTKIEVIKNFKIKKISGYLFKGVSTVSLYRMNCFSTKIGVFLKCSLFGFARKCGTKSSHRAYNVSTRALTSLTLDVY